MRVRDTKIKSSTLKSQTQLQVVNTIGQPATLYKKYQCKDKRQSLLNKIFQNFQGLNLTLV